MTSLDPPAAPAGLRVATPVRRINGFVLDQLIVVTPIVVVALAFGFAPGESVGDDVLFKITVAALTVSFAYYTVMIGLFGRTVGKIAVGTVVVRATDGGRLGWSASTIRALVPLTAGAVPGFGFALTVGVYGPVAFDPLRRGVHDRAAGSLVVRQGERPFDDVPVR